MKAISLKLSCLYICLIALISCRQTTNNNGNNSIYYWRTTFTLSGGERDFLKEHNITKLYIHFFDVDVKDNYDPIMVDATPEATIQFIDSVPKGIEIIPTIYITTPAMASMQLREGEYAQKIYKRVNAICQRNKIGFKELQLDCDWTKTTRKYFFKLCEEMKKCMDSTQTLSSTVRLHQLCQTPPPVDKGVLMVYNTGNLMKITTENSIFSKKDIAPYLRDNRLAKYALPLDIAYPVYGWSILFAHYYPDRYEFERIMRRTDYSEYPLLKKIDKNNYEVTEYVQFSSAGEDYATHGDRIKIERPSPNEILDIKTMIDNQLKDKPHSNIIYHLDESQLSNYSDYEINKIYHRN